MLRVCLLALLHNLRKLLILELLLLRRRTTLLDVLVRKVLALVRLKGRRVLLLLLVVGLRWLGLLGGWLARGSLLLLLLLLLVFEILLLFVQLLLRRTGTGRRVESLVLGRVLRVMAGRRVGLVLWGLLWLLLRRRESLVLLRGVVLLYPALGAIAPFGAPSSEWGPIVLLLVRIGCKLLRVLLVRDVLWRRLRRVVVFLLQKGVQVVLVLLVRRG